jgi:acetylornithine deacetylase/succinyl-diaminopimelate desuccinylase-like protein
MPQWQSYLEQNQDRFLSELIDFVRIPSISALPEHAQDVQRAAEWVAERLRQAGVENVEILPTEGHPVVYGDWLHAPDKPTILIYGHFDVQPVDPVHLWTNPPFEPTIDGDRIYARGASDDKGNMLVPILAVEALLKGEGSAPVNLKFCFEGQEEIGSPYLPAFFEKEGQRFAADLALSADGSQWGKDEPLILLGLRGICGIQIDVKGAKSDLHSGMYGGAIQNPIHALVELLGTMHDRHGRITVEGFYDDVLELSDEEREAIAQVPIDEELYLDDLGLEETFGEPGYTTRERTWIRPTLEINGIWGGFQAEGIKTVLPNEAHAKITCRLVPNQDPARIIELLTEHVRANTPKGVTISIKILGTRGKPYLIPFQHPGNQAVREVLMEIYNTEPYQVRSGGSIPITGLFQDYLNLPTVSFGFGLNDERFHAPDEFYRLSSFRKGQDAYCKLLYRLAETEL